MSNPAAYTDIESRWRPLSVSEKDVAETRLDDAWRLLKRKIPTIEALMAGSDDLQADVVKLLAEAVIRVLSSLQRDGVRKGSVSVDDRTRTWEFGDVATVEGVYFTDDELAALLPNGGDSRPRAFSLMPS